MATQFTRYADQQILNAMFKGVALPALTWYAGALLYSSGVSAGTTPTRDNVSEMTATGAYSRKAVGTFTLTAVNGTAVANVQNDAQVLFDEATADWGNIVGIGLWDAAMNGNLWVVNFTLVNQQRTIRTGDRLTVPAQQIVVSGGAT